VDAFISHSSADVEAARRLEHDLEAAGLSVWLDRSEIRYGVLLGPELRQAILECPVLVLVWSGVAAQSRWVNSEWLMALHQDRLIMACTLDGAPPPQCLANSVYADLEHGWHEPVRELARSVRDAPGGPTPLAPLIRAESTALHGAIVALAEGQAAVMARLGTGDVDAARAAQLALDPEMAAARAAWEFDSMIVNLDGYHAKNAYMIEHWGEIQAGRAPRNALLEHAEARFFDTLSIDPTDPSALNGLGNVLFFGRDLDAAEFFHRAAIAAAHARGMARYPDAEHDLDLVRSFRQDLA
jgi:TIR domain